VSELYQLDPGEFIRARDARVRELKAAGDKEEAARVAKLRKPAPPAWALDRVAHDRPELIEEALAAGAALLDATEAAVGGDRAALRDATAAERAAVDAVVDAAAKVLGGKGAAARPQLAATVRAAVLDPDVAAALREGVLDAAHEASGFGFAGGFELGAPVEPERDDAAERAEREREEAERRAAVDAERARLQRALDDAQAAAAKAEAALDAFNAANP
jgi:hypothetical protein